jgi:hypothetical protein
MTDWTPTTSQQVLITGQSEAVSGNSKLIVKVAAALVIGAGLSIWGYVSSGSIYSFALLVLALVWCVITALNTPADQNVGRAFAITEKAVMFNNRDDVLLDDISTVAGSGTTIILKRKFDKKKPLQITDVSNASAVRELLKKLKFDQRPDYERT